ncbi:MAG: hypothetical protein OH338_02095 [Candidatus Parvarchaeota archaeon]|nr:hypothetical protein [Candidatus Parvarchaeota archaeon]MCW1294738.1 hypothetical protein [Candidatus Parvarchaeum tengchongense]MCW1295530.1 hypothetical protein [Candidatus Parvarchaeum tengchongense]MCW1298792.1 hypothetical protein [Candidatus Parvarchaeum tengchongense]MCW1312203.1 hypothetical protein [Candidatus Parvarchaeum tengchongense]
MEEFRLDPVDLTFDLVSNERTGCRECLPVENAVKSIEFKGGYLRVYEIKDRVQPSRYQLDGKFFKRSNAHGYEELIVENEKHSANFVAYSADDIEKLLLLISDRLKELKAYDIGKNISVSRYVNGHDYWDLVILPIPMHNTQKCHVCESLNYTGNREIYKTENIIAYVPFSPKKNEIARITTLKHTAIEELDSVVAFDLANLLIKIINKFTKEITFNIKQSGADHFELDVLAGENDPIDALGINRISYFPEEAAKKMSEKLNNGK